MTARSREGKGEIVPINFANAPVQLPRLAKSECRSFQERETDGGIRAARGRYLVEQVITKLEEAEKSGPAGLTIPEAIRAVRPPVIWFKSWVVAFDSKRLNGGGWW